MNRCHCSCYLYRDPVQFPAIDQSIADECALIYPVFCCGSTNVLENLNAFVHRVFAHRVLPMLLSILFFCITKNIAGQNNQISGVNQSNHISGVDNFDSQF